MESQFSQLLQQINSTRDFESIRLAHDHFLSNLLAQSFILLKPVSVQNKPLCIPDSVFCFWLNIHFISLPGFSLFEWNSGPVSQLLFPGQSESWASGWKRNSPARYSCEGSFCEPILKLFLMQDCIDGRKFLPHKKKKKSYALVNHNYDQKKQIEIKSIITKLK